MMCQCSVSTSEERAVKEDTQKEEGGGKNGTCGEIMCLRGKGKEEPFSLSRCLSQLFSPQLPWNEWNSTPSTVSTEQSSAQRAALLWWDRENRGDRR